MDQAPIPFERLQYFLEQLNLNQAALARLEPYRQAFLSQSRPFGHHFCAHFLKIERTRLILEQGDNQARLEKILGQWFAALFSENFSQRFVTYLWNSGVRHVQLSLDQRFVNLGYAVTRHYCHAIIQRDLPTEAQEEVAEVVDRMLDFCVLVATDSFITMTSRCDRSMIEGIAHQVRNPITVIGGSISRLQKQTDPDNPAYLHYEMVLKENMRLERMVNDIAAYTGLFQDEPSPLACDLAEALDEARSWVSQRGLLPREHYSQELDPAHAQVMADREELVLMLRYLLENAAEAMDSRDPWVRVTSGPGRTTGFVEIVLANSGQSPDPRQMDEILSPFHSSKPMGTGLGLPIAVLAARRNLGGLSLEPGPQGGALCQVELPVPPAS